MSRPRVLSLVVKVVPLVELVVVVRDDLTRRRRAVLERRRDVARHAASEALAVVLELARDE